MGHGRNIRNIRAGFTEVLGATSDNAALGKCGPTHTPMLRLTYLHIHIFTYRYRDISIYDMYPEMSTRGEPKLSEFALSISSPLTNEFVECVDYLTVLANRRLTQRP